MKEVTEVLGRIGRGDSQAAAALLPLVYDELRKLAAARMGQESAGLTLQATALVMRLGCAWSPGDRTWQNRAQFFAAASEALRRILIDCARRKHAFKPFRQLSAQWRPPLHEPERRPPARHG